jgi:hypothetical protein
MSVEMQEDFFGTEGDQVAEPDDQLAHADSFDDSATSQDDNE